MLRSAFLGLLLARVGPALLAQSPDACRSATVLDEIAASTPPIRAASFAALVVPPVENVPASMQGQNVRVRFLVSESGSIDSLATIGFVDPGYEAALRRSLLSYRFRPAMSGGCPVKSWTAVTLGFAWHGRSIMSAPIEIVGRDWPVMLQPPWQDPPGPPLREHKPGVFARDPQLLENLPACVPHRPTLAYGRFPDPGSVGGNGRVVLRFVVDSAGVPVDSTVRVIVTSGPRFTAAVRHTFSSLRFDPAWCGSGTVAAEIQQTFLFAR